MKKKSKYKSGFERELHAGPLKSCDYEPFDIPYFSERSYIPDFVPKNNKEIVFEAKGRFRDYKEVQKYLDIKRSQPKLRFIFIFQNPKAKAYAQCQRRKDGTFLSLAEWAGRNGFEWFTKDTIPKELLK